MPGNLICDKCNKQIGDYSNTRFSYREKNLDFCSEECRSVWADEFATQFKSIRISGNRLDRHWNDENLDEVIKSYWGKNIDGATAGLVYNMGTEPDEITSQGITIYKGKAYNLRDRGETRVEEPNQDQLTTENWEIWLNIRPDFSEELAREWVNNGFSYKAVNDWINIGLTPRNANYATWLRDVKKVDPEWVLNHGNSEELLAEYRQSTTTEETNSTFHLDNSLNNLDQPINDKEIQTQLTGNDIDELQQRLKSDRQVLKDQLGNEMAARIIDNQNRRWQRQGGNN